MRFSATRGKSSFPELGMKTASIAVLAACLVACGGGKQQRTEIAGNAAGWQQVFGFGQAVRGLLRSSEPVLVVPDSLYAIIDGGAEVYLSYDLLWLGTADFRRVDNSNEYTVQVYRFRSPTDAFGLYGRLRYPDYSFIDLGIQGYLSGNQLVFLHSDYVTQITGVRDDSATTADLKALAGAVAVQLGAPGTWPEALRVFPPRGKLVNSEKFYLRDFLGLGEFAPTFTADYELDGRKLTVLFTISREGQSVQFFRKLVAECAVLDSTPTDSRGWQFRMVTRSQDTLAVSNGATGLLGWIGGQGGLGVPALLRTMQSRLEEEHERKE